MLVLVDQVVRSVTPGPYVRRESSLWSLIHYGKGENLVHMYWSEKDLCGLSSVLSLFQPLRIVRCNVSIILSFNSHTLIKIKKRNTVS